MPLTLRPLMVVGVAATDEWIEYTVLLVSQSVGCGEPLILLLLLLLLLVLLLYGEAWKLAWAW